jgi:hypothetical protein
MSRRVRERAARIERALHGGAILRFEFGREVRALNHASAAVHHDGPTRRRLWCCGAG